MNFPSPLHPDSRILVVDDQEANVSVLRRVLNAAGYPKVEGISDPFLAEERFRSLTPDLVLLDLSMPGLDGFAVLAQMRAISPPQSFVPIVVLTGDDSLEARERALSLGATDFITKPFHTPEVLLRIRNLLETRFLHLLLHDDKALLERRVEEQGRALLRAQEELFDRLGQAAEYRDDETGQHSHRVGALAARLGAAAGFDVGAVEILRQAAPLHDIGKIGIPDRILLKPGPLTPAEFEVMKTHTTIGAALLAGGASPLALAVEVIARSHHERWDGEGYPQGLVGDAIPREARVVSVADFYDALTHDRPYRIAWPVARVVSAIREESGHRFDPALVVAFDRLKGPASP